MVDVIVAPYESDAQLAFLAKGKLVQAVITEDSDLIAFGCEKVLSLVHSHVMKCVFSCCVTQDCTFLRIFAGKCVVVLVIFACMLALSPELIWAKLA